MASRWDLLLENKPVPLLDHLLEEVGKLLAKDLMKWPPPVESLEELGEKFRPLFEPDARRPPPEIYAQAFQLVRWELSRQLDAYDDYMRNRRYLAAGLTEEHRLPLLFLSRWILEQLLGLQEATEGRVGRASLLYALERLERRHRAGQVSA